MSSTTFCQTSSPKSTERHISKAFAQIGLEKGVKAVKQNIRNTPEVIGQRTRSVTSLTLKRITQNTARSLSLILNASNLPNVITKAQSQTSTSNALNFLPSQNVQVLSNHFANHRYFPKGK